MLVAEPRHPAEDVWVLDPLEFVFPANESFKHFALKWVDFEQMATRPVEDATLRERLREVAGLTFQSLGCSGYARCDIRMDAAGELHLLEINPNCGVFYPEESFGSADLFWRPIRKATGDFCVIRSSSRCDGRRTGLAFGIWTSRGRPVSACSPTAQSRPERLWSVTRSGRCRWFPGSMSTGILVDIAAAGSISTPGRSRRIRMSFGARTLRNGNRSIIPATRTPGFLA